MKFGKFFTVELWVRMIESKISQNYYLFQKLETFGLDTPKF